MLVRLKEPMGYSTIDGRRVYGKHYAYGSFGPTKVPRRVYLKNRDVLEEVEITGEWLSKQTNKLFPDVKFLITRMSELTLEETLRIAELLDIKFIKTRNINKAALSRSIVKRIEAL